MSEAFCLALSRIDKDGSLGVEWKEFRNFMQLAPSANLSDLVSYWRQNLVSSSRCGVAWETSP